MAVSGRADDNCRYIDQLGRRAFFWLAILFVLFLFRALLRKEWAAAVALVLLFTVFAAAGSQFDPVALVGVLIFGWLAVFLLIRFGLLALVANFIVWQCPADLSADDPMGLRGIRASVWPEFC